MIVLIQGSNRKNNSTRSFVDYIADYLNDIGEACVILDLEYLPGDILHADMYAKNEHYFLDQAAAEMRKADRWVFVFPEYNGSFPGALKLFIDALSIRDIKTLFAGKKAALVGTASGRAGNLRGMDHFTAILNHLGTTVMPKALPISGIDSMLCEDKKVIDEAIQKSIKSYVDQFLDYSK